MAARNVLGGVYQPGKALPIHVREEILHLFNQGYRTGDISRNLKVSNRVVRKILAQFRAHGTVLPFATGGGKVRVMRDDILEVIEIWKLQKPSIYTAEIRERLLMEGICTLYDLPSIDTINKSLRQKVGMTWKKISSVPREYLNNTEKVDDYLELVSRLNPSNIHFFDEASVIKTTSNRLYGHSYQGTKAIEVQRYASNASYTVNLLHSVFGVDYYNIIPGASNGAELVSFFNYALDCVRPNGLSVFMYGDVVIMDNCGFHHGRLTEGTLRQMFEMRGVTLLFQPPYSPHLNPSGKNADCRLQTADCRLQTADYRLQTADYPLQTAKMET